MPTESSDDTGKDKGKGFPNPSDVMSLMVAMQRFNSQVMWQMSEAMADMMSKPFGRGREDESKSDAFNRCVNDVKDAIESATETLQQGGKSR
jgi:hypothetical protein